MKAEVWEIVGNVASVQALVGVSIAKVAVNALRDRFPSAESLLEACSKDLEKIKTRFEELNDERRKLIHAAVERGDCKSLESLDHNLKEYGLTCVCIHILPLYFQAVR
jgi:hypothetical protein